jgi:molecular chaperone DnaK
MQDIVEFHVERGQTIPCPTKKKRYTTTEDDQTRVDVPIMYGRGESKDPKANTLLEVFVLDRIPPAKKGIPKIDVSFDVDQNGVLTVSAMDVGTGRTASTTVKDCLLLSPQGIDSMAARLREDKAKTHELERLSALPQRINAVREAIEEIARRHSDRQWKNLIGRWSKESQERCSDLDQEQLNDLGEMHRRGHQLVDEFSAILDQARRESCKDAEECAAILEIDPAQADSALLRKRADAGDEKVRSGERHVAHLNDSSARFERWSRLLDEIQPPPDEAKERFHQACKSGSWQRAIAEFEKAYRNPMAVDVPLPEVFLALHAAAHQGMRDYYRALLAQHASRIPVWSVSPGRTNEFCRQVRAAVPWVRTNGLGMGSGFLVTTRHVVTNRHVVAAVGQLPRAKMCQVFIDGAWREIADVRCPSNPDIDLAVLELSAPTSVTPVRLGYGELVEVAEPVIAIGYPLPEGDNAADELMADQGLINRRRARAEGLWFELGLQVQPGMSGGPVFNDQGEVVGVVTLAKYVAVQPESPVLIDKISFAFAVDSVRELIPETLL